MVTNLDILATPAPEHLHHCQLFLHRSRRTTGSVQEGGDVLLRAGTETNGQTDQRRRSRAEEEAHRHLGEAAVEERGQYQRLNPAGCRFLLPWLFRLKTIGVTRGCSNLC